MEEKLIITQYTDPMCVWCYALEPALRRVDYTLGNRVEFHNVMGLLVGDVRQIIGEDELAPLRYEQLRAQMTEHFLDAGARSGMPISVEHMKERSAQSVTSKPMSVAFEAVKLVDEGSANAFLRRMREAAHAEDRVLDNLDALADLASELPVDLDAFWANVESGAAEDALSADILANRTAGVSSFPTMSIEYGGNKVWVSGFRSFTAIERAISEVSGGEIVLDGPLYTPEALMAFVNHYGKVAAQEIKVMFTLSDARLEDAVAGLLASGMFEKVESGTSYFMQARQLMACDPATGSCSFALSDNTM